ncbi:hypothetical protein F53441_7260 [Fusarium austroafricanum]|uniref:Uncharacterized protein n=1 Tax=Fusarium austroafricanum TaxID=2364996 RepID=A0A8H4KG35_9HYPO|nr:hypothetical protein F53441_7260 [Fusarium austroafricanum]
MILGLSPDRVDRCESQSHQLEQDTQTDYQAQLFPEPEPQQPVEKQRAEGRLLTLGEYIDHYGPFDPETAPLKHGKKPDRRFIPKRFHFPDDDDLIDSIDADETETAGSMGDCTSGGKVKEKAAGVSEDTAKDAAKTG